MEIKKLITSCCAAAAVLLCLPVSARASAVGGADTLAPIKFQVAAPEGLIGFRPVGGVVRIGSPIATRLPEFRPWLPIPAVKPVSINTISTVRFVPLLPPARIRP
jgi:hypothetical protein